LSRTYDKRSSIYFYLIISSLKLYNYEKAVYYFKKSFDWIDKPFFVFFSYYEFWNKKIDTGIKIKDLQSILPEDTGDIFNRLTFVIYNLLKRDYNNALDLIKKDYDAHCDLFFYKLIFLKILFKLMKYNEIVDFFINNIEFLHNVDLLAIYAACLYKLKLFDESKKVVDEILKINRIDIISQVNIAKIFINKKKYIKAINLLKTMEKHSKKYSDGICFYLSIAYHKLGMLNDFAKYAFKISKKSIEFNKIMLNLSITYYDLGYFEKSKDIFTNIDKNAIDALKYNKWHNLIINNKLHERKFNNLKYLINLLPFFIIIFSIAVLIFFLILNK